MLFSNRNKGLLVRILISLDHSVSHALMLLLLIFIKQAPALHGQCFGCRELPIQIEQLEEFVEVLRPLGDHLRPLELDQKPLYQISPRIVPRHFKLSKLDRASDS
jgi:hypothetical protein